jgi:hypothetical protein
MTIINFLFPLFKIALIRFSAYKGAQIRRQTFFHWHKQTNTHKKQESRHKKIEKYLDKKDWSFDIVNGLSYANLSIEFFNRVTTMRDHRYCFVKVSQCRS